jgi:NNP family nitrate/nitrite transporter-like MFS transporter
MSLQDLRRPGHWPSLLGSFLYFDMSIMVWILLGALGNSLADEFGLSPSQKGIMVATPILGGAMLRLVFGVLADRLGTKRAAMIGLGITMAPLLLGWLWVNRFPQLLLVGLLLGVAGASFAVAIPMASRWYPEEQQGLVLGIVGAGNSGTAIATMLAPRLVPLVGWHGVFGLSLIPIVLVFLFVALLVKDSPAQPAPRRWKDYLSVLGLSDTYWFCGFYSMTFGGFVGLTSYLSIYFHDQYGLDPIRAGTFATICALAGSLFRPLGGYLADRLSGEVMLLMLFLGLGVLGLRMSYIPRLDSSTLTLFVMMAMLGMGSGAIFQIVPRRFPEEIGVLAGLVGAAGGLGGFILPLVLGYSRQWTGRFGPGFFLLGLGGFASAGMILQASRSWQKSSQSLAVRERSLREIQAGAGG